MLSRLLPLIAVLCWSSALQAQSEPPPRFQLYGGYSFLSDSFNGVPGSRQPLNGWDAAMAFPSWHHIRFKIDASSYRGTNLGAPQDAFFIMGGAQFTWCLNRESLFAEGLAGDAGLNRTWPANQVPGETASFVGLMGGGLDTPLRRRIAFRVSGGFQYSYFALVGPPPIFLPYRTPGLPTNFGRISSGLVWQF
jgi:hypothetical protein